MTKLVPFPPSDGWACACVKRDMHGQISKIKINSPRRKRCSVCGCTPDAKKQK